MNKYILLILLLFVTSCSYQAEAEAEAKDSRGSVTILFEGFDSDRNHYKMVQYPNGLICASVDGGYDGGLSCNWNEYKAGQEQKEEKDTK